MAQQIFRQKSLDRLSSPEALNDYMHVTSPSVWVMLTATVLLLAGIIVWSNFAVIESRATGTAVVSEDNISVILKDRTNASKIEKGMSATIGGVNAQITFTGRGEEGQVLIGVDQEIPAGSYDFSATYKTTKVIEMLFS